MRKNGATHIGFILSFVIFMMFIIFMFSAIEPFLKTQASKQSLLDFFRFSLVDEFQAGDLVVMTIFNKSFITSQQDCISLQGIAGTGENQISQIFIENNNLLIKDNSGENFNYGTPTGESGNLKIGVWTQGYLKENGYFLKIYYSEDINYINGGTGTGCVSNNDYKVGYVVEEQSQILESNIDSLKEKYDSDCGETIKKDLGIPEGNEFTFRFESADGTIVIEPNMEACGGIPNTNVYATTFPLQYLDGDANLQIGFLTIKVW